LFTKTEENTAHEEIVKELTSAVRLRVVHNCYSYYFYGTHLDPHCSAILLNHRDAPEN